MYVECLIPTSGEIRLNITLMPFSSFLMADGAIAWLVCFVFNSAPIFSSNSTLYIHNTHDMTRIMT